tara:strand:- start:1692 stop:2321 length:630 start_codon:yes stop_codon:yes gene_type:complete
MNYTELTQNINDKCEYAFTAAQLKLFVQNAEQSVYNTVQIPALRKNVSGNMTTAQPYLSTPDDFLWGYSLAVVDSNGAYTYLINKDVNFIREAYPNPTSTGAPRHYAYFDKDSFLLGPTPDSAYTTELHYGYYPESIVTAGTTWLGEEFDTALFNGAMMEAASFLKQDADVIAGYEKLYLQAITLLKNLGDGKLREDTYRSGQYKQPVT